MEFGIISICIGPSPIVFLVRAASLTVTTILSMTFLRFICKDSRFHPPEGKPIRKIWILSLILVGIVFGFSSIVVSRILFHFLLALLIGPGVCTAFVRTTGFEMLIPVTGAFLTAARKINSRVFRTLRVPLLILFLCFIFVSTIYGVYENIIFYDLYLSSGGAGDYLTFLRYEPYIDLMAICSAIFFAALVTLLCNKLRTFTHKRFPVSQIPLFILAVASTFMVWNIIYIEAYWYFVSKISDLFFLYALPVFPRYGIPLITFGLITFFQKRQKHTQVLPARIRFEQIKNVSACPALWQEMIGDNMERFCHLCGKQTYNLKEITNAEAQNLISKPGDFIYVRKDGAIMATDCYAGLKPIQRFVIRFQKSSKD